MDLFGRFDAGVVDRGAHPFRHRIDLREAAQMLVGQRRRARPPDRQRASRLRPAGLAHLEHQEMRGQRTLRSPRHHDAGLVGVAVFAMRSECVLQRAGRESAREVVDEAVALGLAEHGDDAIRLDRSVFDARLETGDVVGSFRGKPMHVGATRRHGRLARTAFESATAPNTPPCIVTILIAA